MKDPGIFLDPMIGYLARQAVVGLPPIYEELHAEASRRNFPIVGPEAARFFLQLARLRRPRRILELGSGYGYSAITWALGCAGEVEIHCTDFKQENIALGRSFAEKAGVASCIHWHEGHALESARGIDGAFDIIFVDIDKPGYPEAYDFAMERLRPGDVLLFDNMLWHGNVAEPDPDETTRAIRGLTQRAYADARIDVSLIPIRDGLMMAVRR